MLTDVDQRIKQAISRGLGVPADVISEESSVRSLPQWKGKNHYQMIQALEKEFGIKFEAQEIETLVNYKIIRATVMAYVG